MRVWLGGRDGNGGQATWPDVGGLNDQAAWTFDAFRILAGVNARLDELARGASE